MVSKGIDCYSFLTHSDYSVRYEVPGKSKVHRAVSDVEKSNLQVDSSEISGWFDYTGDFRWRVGINGNYIATRYNSISSLSGNLSGGSMTDMLKTGPILRPDCTICYGFFDSGSGITGLTNQDQSYVYCTGNYSSWMGGLTVAFPDAAQEPFNRWVLPGAHDAGMNTLDTVSKVLNSTVSNVLLSAMALFIPGSKRLTKTFAPLGIQNFALTQKDKITEMLDVGARYFDFRPGYMFIGLRSVFKGIYHQHAVIPGLGYQDFLEELLRWLDTHPSEVVVVACGKSGFAESDMVPPVAELDKLLDQARTSTGVSTARLKTGDKTSLTKTIAELRASKTRLIFLNQMADETHKYDSYGDAYGTLKPDPIVKELAKITADGLAASEKKHKITIDYVVLQLQGTCTVLPSVMASSAITLSRCSSPLLMTKAQFDKATLPWVFKNAAKSLPTGYLAILLNDFIDGATVSTAIDVTKKRMGLWKN